MYIQSNKLNGADANYEEAPGRNGQWQCFCDFQSPLSPDITRFPREGAGFVQLDTRGTTGAPSFAKKKDAKVYAAQCVVEWLLVQGETVKFPKRNPPKLPPPTSPVPGQLASREGTTTKAQLTSQKATTPAAGASVNEKTSIADTSTSASDEDEVPATERVRVLSQALGFNVPQYKLEPVQLGMEQTSFWNGTVDFGSDASDFPEGLGRVKECYGKSTTKERMAEEVLKFLLEVKTSRDKQLGEAYAAMGDNVTDKH